MRGIMIQPFLFSFIVKNGWTDFFLFILYQLENKFHPKLIGLGKMTLIVAYGLVII